MSEDKVQEKAQEMTTQSQNSSETDSRDSELLREIMQKKERLNSAIERADTLQSKYDDLQKQVANEQESQKIKEMESKGEYDKIMAEMTSKLETSEKKSKAWDEFESNRRELLLERLPEDDRATYDGLSLEKLEVHVDKFNSKPNPANVDNSTPNATGGYETSLEWAVNDPAGYEKAKKGTGVKSKFGNIFSPRGND